MCKRGEIYYIESHYTTGSEQRAGRPAIVVSNEKNNANSSTVEVIYLTTQPKHDLPTHVTVRGTGKESIALCEQITSISTERLGQYCGECNKQEMAALETAMLISLDISMSDGQAKEVEVVKEVIKEVPAADSEEVKELQRKLAVAEGQTDMMRKMYNELLKKVMK